MRFAIVLLAALFVLVHVFPLRAQAQQIEVNGVLREYRLHVPRRLSSPAPLLIVLHGGGGNARQIERFTGFSRLADREGFMVVYPQGINRQWNDGRSFEDSGTADDVGFIAALIDHLVAAQSVDPARVYATGISNGGFMSYRLGCQLSDRIAGIAPVAATLSEDLAADCAPLRPLPVMMVNGTADPLVPYDGGVVSLPGGRSRGQIRSAEVTAAFWAAHNGCDSTPLQAPLPDGSTVEISQYDGCDAPVVLYTIRNGGHTWPGAAQYLPVRLIGGTNRDMNATEAIWSFFKAL